MGASGSVGAEVRAPVRGEAAEACASASGCDPDQDGGPVVSGPGLPVASAADHSAAERRREEARRKEVGAEEGRVGEGRAEEGGKDAGEALALDEEEGCVVAGTDPSEPEAGMSMLEPMDQMPLHERHLLFYAAWALHKQAGFAATQEEANKLAAAWKIEPPQLPSVLLAPGVANLLRIMLGALEAHPEAKAAVVAAVREAEKASSQVNATA